MNYKFKTKPYGHQLDALEASWDKENFAYFMEMGTGKSKVLLDNAAILYDKGLINGLLLIAPLRSVCPRCLVGSQRGLGMDQPLVLPILH